MTDVEPGMSFYESLPSVPKPAIYRPKPGMSNFLKRASVPNRSKVTTSKSSRPGNNLNNPLLSLFQGCLIMCRKSIHPADPAIILWQQPKRAFVTFSNTFLSLLRGRSPIEFTKHHRRNQRSQTTGKAQDRAVSQRCTDRHTRLLQNHNQRESLLQMVRRRP